MSKKTKFLEPWLTGATAASLSKEKATARLLYNPKDALDLPGDCPQWRRESLKKANAAVTSYDTDQGPVWLVSPFLKPEKTPALAPDPWLEPSAFAKVRDAAGQALQQIQKSGVPQLDCQLPENEEDARAFLAGFEIANYRYKTPKDQKPLAMRWRQGKSTASDAVLRDGELAGWCVNVARHLVNMPPNELNPGTFAGLAKKLCDDLNSVEVEVWEGERLKRERCHLLLAVGEASATPPCLVRLRYRPSSKAAPIALVGKGVTFDSGGLDLKTASGMRLMKKDMGGAASVFAAFLWAAMSESPHPLDAYLSLAENAVGSQSFRPSDVYVARGGQTVEISNTDAEGRLVLADALDVAITQKEEPSVVVDVATLTGAVKVGLGSRLPGLFSNHSPLREELRAQFSEGGDAVWPMPLFQKYRTTMTSTVADMINSVEVPFGGAVTAALFLESFVREKPWAHLDIYAWKDGAEGAWAEAGGSGQGVLGLIQWLRNRPTSPKKSRS